MVSCGNLPVGSRAFLGNWVELMKQWKYGFGEYSIVR
jgi:hypothetical protein